MNPGIYDDLSNEDYHSSPGISKSGLDLINKSPYLFSNRPKQEPTKAMLIGSATHTAVLERDLFADQYVWAPNVDGRTKAGKEELALFASENVGKTVLKSEEFDLIANISRSVWNNPIAANILDEQGQDRKSTV